MPRGDAISIRRQNGNRGLSMVGYGSHRRHRGGCGNHGRVAERACPKDRRQDARAQTQPLQSVIARWRRRLPIRVYLVIPRIRYPHSYAIRPDACKTAVPSVLQGAKVLRRIVRSEGCLSGCGWEGLKGRAGFREKPPPRNAQEREKGTSIFLGVC